MICISYQGCHVNLRNDMHLGVLVFATVLGQFFSLSPSNSETTRLPQSGGLQLLGEFIENHTEYHHPFISKQRSWSTVGDPDDPLKWNSLTLEASAKNTAKGPFESAIRLDMTRLPFRTTVRSFDAL